MKRHASLNRIYRLVWSQVLNAWVAVAETTKGRGKTSTRSKLVIAATTLLGLAGLPQALAGPVGGEVTAGSGTITQSGNATVINQASQKLSINWADFSIPANEAVRFNQPNSSSIVLNRVLGQNVSQIYGALSANGQVFILNPNGILFGNGAQVNVGSLVASTLSLSNDDFMAGRFSFSNNGSSGSVINQGSLTASQSGYIAMLAPQVINEGVISATMGKAVLAAGNQVTLNIAQGSLVGFSIDKGAFQALVDNKQLIEADGGQIFMSAKAADAITRSMVNNTGIVEARTLANVNGRIEMLADMQNGVVNVGGTLDASAPHGGDGGFIETSAARVKVANDAHVTAAAPSGNMGSWLIDPTDFTISAGTGAQTSSGMGATTLQTALNTANLTITTEAGSGADSGNINVNAAVSWSFNSTLTLSAYNNININQSITATTGKLALYYGQGASDGVINGVASTYNVNAPVNLSEGQNFSTQLGSAGALKQYYVITSLGAEGSNTDQDLQGIAGSGYYALGSNIDASATSAWNSGAGFQPIQNFSGSFDGLGHTINHLTIYRPYLNGVGLFDGVSVSNTASIANVGLLDVDITGANYTGALSGMNFGAINNVYVTGNVTCLSGSYGVGGLVGANYGTINNSHTNASVSGSYGVGGLVGANYGAINNSYAAGNVLSETFINPASPGSYYGSVVGGLVGKNASSGTINNSYATGAVASSININASSGWAYDLTGGLVGINFGSISGSHATGNVSSSIYLSGPGSGKVGGIQKVGGLAGASSGPISDSYATGAVSAQLDVSDTGATSLTAVQAVGGLVGWSGSFNTSGNTIDQSYATGDVSGSLNLSATGSSNADNVSFYGHVKVGGLVGWNGSENSSNTTNNINLSHATGNVTSQLSFNINGFGNFNGNLAFAVGGLVGLNGQLYGSGNNSQNITQSYSTGNVSVSVTGAYYYGNYYGSVGGWLEAISPMALSKTVTRLVELMA